MKNVWLDASRSGDRVARTSPVAVSTTYHSTTSGRQDAYQPCTSRRLLSWLKRSALPIGPGGSRGRLAVDLARVPLSRTTPIDVRPVLEGVGDRVGGAQRCVQLVGAGKVGAEIAALVGNHLGVELQVQTQGELKLRREGLSAAGGLGARVPTGDGGARYLERIEAMRR